MIFDIHVSRVEVTESTRDYLARRLDFALDRFEHAIGGITVTLADINGPRGGEDQQCRIRISLVGDRNPVITESVETSLKAAIDLACDAASRAVAKKIDKANSIRRTSREEIPA